MATFDVLTISPVDDIFVPNRTAHVRVDGIGEYQTSISIRARVLAVVRRWEPTQATPSRLSARPEPAAHSLRFALVCADKTFLLRAFK